jgi:3-oxoacyl-[acyl-carrier-protein] synthase-1
LSGHSLGAAGVQEAIYSLLMMQNGFIAGTANLNELDAAIADLPIVGPAGQEATLNAVMSNSFGFGGTNASLIFERL